MAKLLWEQLMWENVKGRDVRYERRACCLNCNEVRRNEKLRHGGNVTVKKETLRPPQQLGKRFLSSQTICRIGYRRPLWQGYYSCIHHPPVLVLFLGRGGSIALIYRRRTPVHHRVPGTLDSEARSDVIPPPAVVWTRRGSREISEAPNHENRFLRWHRLPAVRQGLAGNTQHPELHRTLSSPNFVRPSPSYVRASPPRPRFSKVTST